MMQWKTITSNKNMKISNYTDNDMKFQFNNGKIRDIGNNNLNGRINTGFHYNNVDTGNSYLINNNSQLNVDMNNFIDNKINFPTIM